MLPTKRKTRSEEITITTTNGSRLRELMTEEGMTQIELARRLKVGEATVSRWARGLPPSEPNRKRIARRFKVEPQEIWPEA